MHKALCLTADTVCFARIKRKNPSTFNFTQLLKQKLIKGIFFAILNYYLLEGTNIKSYRKSHHIQKKKRKERSKNNVACTINLSKY